MTEKRFRDKVVLVTGGSSGIGRATALAFAGEGARVVVASRGRERGEAVARELAEVGAFKATADFEEEEFDRQLATNLKSVWLCMKAEIARMLGQGGGGGIVNTSSINGLGGVPQNALYAAAKAGVLGLTKSAAQEYAAAGIRINALVAGGFRTPMLEDALAQASPGDPEAAAGDRDLPRPPTGRRRSNLPTAS